MLLQYEMLECGLYHDENGYLCKSESWLLTCLKMVIRYDSAHRGLIYLLISLFFVFIITITYSFVERGMKVASAAVAHVVVVIKY